MRVFGTFIISNIVLCDKSYCSSFLVVGCPDITAPPGAQVKRDGDQLTVICGPVTRSLTCNKSKWIGNVGNCSVGE